MPVLEALLSQFPFVADGFHSDNGSEHVNHRVAALPGRLHVGKFTKSRARRFAGIVNAFAQRELSPFLNFHRPCLFATERLGAAGNAGAAAESSRCAAPPLRSGPSGDMAAAPA
ncbi:MAG: hypothetical protein OXF72_07115 [Gammaproteobacteria bacterium]|nr:hypothetical protein [Gammaproteobacteria bacterium]MCY4276677.1 hypothetical protein [Gammaproteobacteria bacterium]